jgi:putative DNA topoisomerase
MSKKSTANPPLFSQHEHALQKAYEVCPSCGAELQLKHGKTGVFLGCANYPNCQYTRAVHEQERIEDQLLVGSVCPLCTEPLAVKQGRYGIFIGCTNYPTCHHVEDQKPKTADVSCPKCQRGTLQERLSRFGKLFYSCDQYPSCQYIVNYQPVAHACPQCAWPIMVKRSMVQGDMLMCPEKKCGHKMKAV